MKSLLWCFLNPGADSRSTASLSSRCGPFFRAPKPRTRPSLALPLLPLMDSISACFPCSFDGVPPLLLVVSPSCPQHQIAGSCEGWSWEGLAVTTEVFTARSLPSLSRQCWAQDLPESEGGRGDPSWWVLSFQPSRVCVTWFSGSLSVPCPHLPLRGPLP